MHAILAIIQKDILQWTRRPLYFIASVLLAILILVCVGSTLSGADDMPFGLYDPAGISDLSKNLNATKRFQGEGISGSGSGRKLDLGQTIDCWLLANVSAKIPWRIQLKLMTAGNNPLNRPANQKLPDCWLF